METAQKVKERLKQMNEDPTTMQQVYYYGKIILISAVVVGFLYFCYKYDFYPDAAPSAPNATNLQSAAALPQATKLTPMAVDGSTSVPSTSLPQPSSRELLDSLKSSYPVDPTPIANTLNGSGGGMSIDVKDPD